MSAEQNNPGYMLLFKNNAWQKNLSAEEIQKIASQWMAWFQRLSEEGKVIGGNPLESDTKIVTAKSGKILVDGPYAESKEAIGGYFMLRVNTMDEAVAIAKQCPGLDYGAVVEVRPVAESCPLVKQCRESGVELTEATA